MYGNAVVLQREHLGFQQHRSAQAGGQGAGNGVHAADGVEHRHRLVPVLLEGELLAEA